MTGGIPEKQIAEDVEEDDQKGDFESYFQLASMNLRVAEYIRRETENFRFSFFSVFSIALCTMKTLNVSN